MRARLVVTLLVVGWSLAPGMACAVQEEGAAGGGLAAEEQAVPAPAASEPEVIVRADPPRNGRSVANRLEDQALAARIKIALVEEASLRPFDFEPFVVDGYVTLHGEVHTTEQRRRASEVAEGVEGVRRVTNAVEVPGMPALEAPRQPVIVLEEPTLVPEQPDLAEQQAASPEAESASEVAAAAPEPAATAESETYHTVRSGESLWAISRQYGVPIEQIRELNNLRSNNIRPGQQLRVK